MTYLPHIDLTPPAAPNPTAPRSSPQFILEELQDLAELRRSLPSLPKLLRMPKRRQHAVLLIPGWKMPEETLYALRTYLRALGYDAHGWGLGTNQGQPEEDSQRMLPVIQDAYSRFGKKVTLIGWSLGGVIAREVARLLPHQVERVITLATPVVGGPTYTLGAHAWGAAECLRIARGVAELDETNPIRVVSRQEIVQTPWRSTETSRTYWALHPDENRFLMIRELQSASSDRQETVVIVENFFEELQQRFAN